MIADNPPIVIDLDLFGFSDHSDHAARARQRNYGGGITAGLEVGDQADLVTSWGTYLDSYDQHAKYAMAGLRYIVGDRTALHAALVVEMGWLDGSNIRGPTMLPVVQFGYDRVDLCVTGARPSEGPGASWMVAVFCEVRLVTF
jgi:hypothetical protein